MKQVSKLNMKKYLIILVCILLVGLVVMPFFLSSTQHDSLLVSTNLVSSISSCVTLLLAILLYSKYGVEKNLLNKQTEVVFSLLQELKKSRFLFFYEGGVLQLFLDNLDSDLFDRYKDKQLLFGRSYIQGLSNIWKISEDVFLPKSIHTSLVPLLFITINFIEDKGDHLQVRIPMSEVSEESEGPYGLLNNSEMTFKEFTSLWKSVTQLTIKWLNDTSNIKVDLNFENTLFDSYSDKK